MSSCNIKEIVKQSCRKKTTEIVFLRRYLGNDHVDQLFIL